MTLKSINSKWPIFTSILNLTQPIVSNFNTPLEAFNHWLEKDPDFIFLRQPVNRKFIEYSRQDTYNQASKIAAALQKMGLKKGDHVALLSKNCAHWFMADLAIMMGGFVSVPLYPTLDKDTIAKILVHSESKAIIVGKLDDYAPQKAAIPDDLTRIGIELYGIDEQHSWEELQKEAYPDFTPHALDPESLITIMYTSGTTGDPKGVMHLVKSFNRVATIAFPALKQTYQKKYFSYLPLSHIAERIGGEMGSIYSGGCVSFAESLDTFGEDLASVNPDYFGGVPRIYQKFQEKVLEKFPQKKLDRLISIPILGQIIKKKIRRKMGLDNAQQCYIGAAPSAVSMLEWFDKIGINILQGYGMTEDCILSHFNVVGNNKFGTVGRPFPGVESRISDEGELQISNGCLMVGYYKNPEKTAEMFTEDGFLRTGDIGEFDEEGYLTITGRMKDQFKTDKGKYVIPAQIELLFYKNADIEQICVVGVGLAQPIALSVPSEAGLGKSKIYLENSILATIDEINPTLMAHEKVAKAVIMKDPWTVENGLMTPSLKIRRPKVEALHSDMYQTWYHKEEKCIHQ